MRTTAIATIVSFAMAPAFAQTTETPAQTGAAAGETDQAAQVDLPAIPAEEEATLADCRIWVSTLGEMIEAGEGEEDARAEADDAQQQANQACDDGNYYEGIVMAAEAIHELQGEEMGGATATTPGQDTEADVAEPEAADDGEDDDG